MNANTERTWWQRNTKWIVLGAILTGLLFLATLVLGIFFVVVAATRSSEVYQTSVARAQADPEVIARLGEPVEPGLLVSGNIQVENREGEAEISIPLSGPQGEATLTVVAHKRAGVWRYEIMQVESTGAAPIDLALPEERANASGETK